MKTYQEVKAKMYEELIELVQMILEELQVIDEKLESIKTTVEDQSQYN